MPRVSGKCVNANSGYSIFIIYVSKVVLKVETIADAVLVALLFAL